MVQAARVLEEVPEHTPSPIQMSEAVASFIRNYRKLGYTDKAAMVILNTWTHWWYLDVPLFVSNTTIAARLDTNPRTVRRFYADARQRGHLRSVERFTEPGNGERGGRQTSSVLEWDGLILQLQQLDAADGRPPWRISYEDISPRTAGSGDPGQQDPPPTRTPGSSEDLKEISLGRPSERTTSSPSSPLVDPEAHNARTASTTAAAPLVGVKRGSADGEGGGPLFDPEASVPLRGKIAPAPAPEGDVVTKRIEDHPKLGPLVRETLKDTEAAGQRADERRKTKAVRKRAQLEIRREQEPGRHEAHRAWMDHLYPLWRKEMLKHHPQVTVPVSPDFMERKGFIDLVNIWGVDEAKKIIIFSLTHWGALSKQWKNKLEDPSASFISRFSTKLHSQMELLDRYNELNKSNTEPDAPDDLSEKTSLSALYAWQEGADTSEIQTLSDRLRKLFLL